jgi:hypothetical protein
MLTAPPPLGFGQKPPEPKMYFVSPEHAPLHANADWQLLGVVMLSPCWPVGIYRIREWPPQPDGCESGA